MRSSRSSPPTLSEAANDEIQDGLVEFGRLDFGIALVERVACSLDVEVLELGEELAKLLIFQHVVLLHDDHKLDVGVGDEAVDFVLFDRA